jgi:LysM repeat protein
MKQVVVISVMVLLLATLFANSQTRTSRSEYIDAYKALAISEMHRTGIPASIKMAQACLESSNGNSKLSLQSNNHFGIKCRNDWKGARVYHDDDRAKECFRKYRTVEESYIDHSGFLTENTRYSGLFQLDKYNYKAWAHGLRSAGYATDPKYATKLINLIESERLYLLDKVTPQELAASYDAAGHNTQKNTEKATVRDRIAESLGNLQINPFERREVETFNGLEAIHARADDTYESIAREFDLKLWQVHLYNDLPKDAVQPSLNERIYLQRKRFSAPKENEFHTVRPGESMWSISQKYGIRVNRLYRLNRMSGDEVPAVGEKLYMRSRKPRK